MLQNIWRNSIRIQVENLKYFDQNTGEKLEGHLNYMILHYLSIFIRILEILWKIWRIQFWKCHKKFKILIIILCNWISNLLSKSINEQGGIFRFLRETRIRSEFSLEIQLTAEFLWNSYGILQQFWLKYWWENLGQTPQIILEFFKHFDLNFVWKTYKIFDKFQRRRCDQNFLKIRWQWNSYGNF